MASNSVGTLSLFLNADAAGLTREFNKVDRTLARWSKSFTEPGAKMALGFLGVESALKAVTNEVRNVVMNIENIQGVSPEAQASIITLRDNLASAKNWIDRMTASAIGFGAQFAQAVGVGAASLMGYEDAGGLGELETPDQIAKARDPQYLDKITEAQKRLNEAKKATAQAAMDEADKIIALRVEAERYETFAKGSAQNTLQRLEAQTEAQKKLAEAEKTMRGLQKELEKSEKEVYKSATGVSVAKATRAEAIEGLENRKTQLEVDLYNNTRDPENPNKARDPNDPKAVQERIKLNTELADVQTRLGSLYEKNQQRAEAFAGSVTSGLVDGMMAGQKFSDTMKQIALDIAAAWMKQQLLNLAMGTMGKGQGGGIIGSIAGFLGKGAAAGGFRDGSRPYMVGERGPELFVPGGPGTVIPNHMLKGEKTGGDTYYIDARSADRTGLAQLEAAIRAVNGSIEHRALAVVLDDYQRAGVLRKAIG